MGQAPSYEAWRSRNQEETSGSNNPQITQITQNLAEAFIAPAWAGAGAEAAESWGPKEFPWGPAAWEAWAAGSPWARVSAFWPR